MILTVDTDKMVENKLLTLLARGSMIFATFIALPIAAWLLLRVISTGDAIAEKVEKIGVRQELLEQAVKFGFDSNKDSIAANRAQLMDHEGRIRTIERNPVLRSN